MRAKTVVGSARIAERRRSVRREQRRRRRRIAIALALAGAVAYGSVALTRSSVFRLSDVEVVGARTVSAADVIAASGLHPGARALSLNLGAIEARIEAMPLIRDARIERVGALGVRIHVSERRPVLEIATPAGSWFVDQDGKRMDVVARHGALPIVALPANATADATAQPLTSVAVRATLSFWRKAPTWLRSKISSLAPSASGRLSFLFGRTTVVFGPVEHVKAKIAALDLVRRRVHAAHHRLVRIDVRAPESPAVRIG